MGEAPSYGIATGNRFAMVDIGDDIEDPAEFYNLIEQSNAAKKAESKKKKEKKPEKKKEEEKKPEKKEEEVAKENTRGRGRGRGVRGNSRGRGGERDGSTDNRRRYNRDNDDSRPPRMQDDGGDSKPEDGDRPRGGYRGRGNNRGRGRGGYRGSGRQYDRHSADGRSGKPSEKRDGGGAHNWGTPVEEAAAPNWSADAAAGDGWTAAAEAPAADAGGWGDVQPAASTEASGFDNVQPSSSDAAPASGFDNVQPSGSDSAQPSGFDNVEGAGENADAGPPKEEEPDQMTYEEYLEKCNNEKKETVFNIRKPGENEDGGQWKNFAPLKKEDQNAYMGGMDEYEKIIVRGGRKKTHFDVDVKFSNPSRRGGRGREERGGSRGGRDRREDRSDRREDRGDRREDRGDRRDNRAQAAPKAPNLESFSETEFPSLS